MNSFGIVDEVEGCGGNPAREPPNPLFVSAKVGHLVPVGGRCNKGVRRVS